MARTTTRRISAPLWMLLCGWWWCWLAQQQQHHVVFVDGLSTVTMMMMMMMATTRRPSSPQSSSSSSLYTPLTSSSTSSPPSSSMTKASTSSLSSSRTTLRETAAAIWQWDVLNRPRPRVGTGANPERMLDAIEQALLLIDALAPPPPAAAALSTDTTSTTTTTTDATTDTRDYDDSNNDVDVAEDRRQDAMTVLVTGLRDYNDAPEQFQDYIFDRLHDQLDVSERLYVDSMTLPRHDMDASGTMMMMPHEGAVVHRFWSRGLDDLDDMYRKRRHRGGGDDEYFEEGNDQAWLHQQLQEQERFAVRSYVDRIPDTDITDYDHEINDDDDDDDDQLRLEDVLRTNLAKVLASTLTSQQLQVLQHVYGLKGTTTTGAGSLLIPPPTAPLTVDETARKLGLSRPRVERLLDRALTRLRRAFALMYLSSSDNNGDGGHRRIQHDDKKKLENEEEDSMIFEEDST